MIVIDAARIKSKLDELRAKDTSLEIFGASSHRYLLHPALTEEAVATFERRWRFSLPDDYRRFLLEIGDGGAGPYYGVFRLGEEDDGFGFREWRYLVGDPSKPFKHTDDWNLPARVVGAKPGPGLAREQEKAAWQAYHGLVEQAYEGLMDGAIPICHLGCALRHWLVVTGPCAGEVWADDRADERGIGPLKRNGRRLSFMRWYEDWLDASLRKLLD